MITLITGGPGAGKTALAIHLYLTESKGRPLFSNIRGLKIDHSPVPHLDEWTVFEKNDQGSGEFRFTFPENAIIILDEAQQFFRPRASGSKVPPYIQAFETHRQDGIDFILITQHSSFIDNNIRKLVKNARHIFIKPGFLGRYIFERPDLIDEDDRTQLQLSKKTKYTLPTYVFSLYNSAKKHTKPTRPGLPIQAYIFVGAILILIAGAWYIYGRTKDIMQPKMPDKPETHNTGNNLGPSGETQSSRWAQISHHRVPERLIEATTPIDDHNPLSAPLYADIAPPVTPPNIIGCISSKKSCTCYTQQATPIWVPDPQCRQRAAGQYYDPYARVEEPQTHTGSGISPGPRTTDPPHREGDVDPYIN